MPALRGRYIIVYFFNPAVIEDNYASVYYIGKIGPFLTLQGVND
jgi:hypothetical protein